MTLWLLALIPTRLPCGEQPHDHPRAGVGLSGARRPLDGERALRPAPTRAGAPHRAPSRRCSEGGSPVAWPSDGGRARSRSRAARQAPEASIPFATTHSPRRRSAARCSLSPKMFERDERLGMLRFAAGRQFELDDGSASSTIQVLRRDLPRAPLRVRLRRGSFRGRRARPRSDVVVLGRESIAPASGAELRARCRLERLADRSDELERPERVLVGGELRRDPCPCD